MPEQSGINSEVVEIYVPRNLEYLSALYQWLKEQLKASDFSALLRGFSLYEVSGAYVGQTKDYTEQTLVVRLIFDIASEPRERISHEERINSIAEAVLEITQYKEEQIWLIRMPAIKTQRGPRRIYASGL